VTVSLYVGLNRARTHRLGWRQVAGWCLLVLMLLFFAATLPKLLTGGWLPVCVGVAMFLMMSTWWSGSRRLAASRRRAEVPAPELLDRIEGEQPRRIPGDVVFLTHDSEVAPLGLLVLVDDVHVIPERVVLLSWHVEDTPSAPAHETAVEVVTYRDRYAGVLAVDVTLGYRERLDVVHVLGEACKREPAALEGLDPDAAFYVVSDPIPRLTRGGMARWRQRLFLLIDRLSTDRVDQLELPRARSVVIGVEVEL
jgi:KUP system potassium uptake protein